MALCRHTLEDVFLFDCAGHMQTLSRLAELLDQRIHSQILIAGFSFHIISILFYVFIFVEKMHSVAWKEHDTTHHSVKVLPMKNMSCAINDESCICMLFACVANAACMWHYLQSSLFTCIVGLPEKHVQVQVDPRQDYKCIQNWLP